MEQEITTKYLMERFGITRQTLYNWIKLKEVSEPKRDWRGWRMWTQIQLSEIENLINNKNNKQNRIQQFNNEGFEINNRRYLGSKYKLLGFISDVVEEHCININSVADIFAGTGCVGYKFFNDGKKIIVNDILTSNFLAYNVWFGTQKVDKIKIKNIIDEFNNTKVKDENYFSKNFGGRYFSYENSRKIGEIREKIELLEDKINFREKAVLITSLIYAADKVANTCGHYDAYRKKLDSIDDIKLLMPKNLINSPNLNEIYNEDANELVKRIHADLTYIDTPYNSRQYGDAYHLLENLALWEKPKVEGIAMKMVNRNHIKSKYCTAKAPEAFEDLINNIDSRYILVSYNNMANKGVGRSNAKISNEEIIDILKSRGNVKKFSIDYKFFTTGKTNLENHKEILYLCKCK